MSLPKTTALPKPISSGSEAKLKVKFRFSPKELIEEEIQEIKLIKWYPRLWWNGLPNHDVFKVKLDIPTGYALAINGRLKNLLV
jgi:hypothetical protein